MVASLKLPLSVEPERPGPLAYLVVPLVYWLSAVVGSRLVVIEGGISLLWAPNAILLAALVRYRGRGWTAFALSGILAEVAADVPRFPLGEALVYGCANVVETSVAWLLLRRWRFDARFHDVGDVGHFVLAAPLAGALVGASVGTLFLHLLGAAGPSAMDAILVWWFGDGLGLLIFTPLYLSLWVPERSPAPRLPSRPFVDLAMAIAGLATLAAIGAHDVVLPGAHLRPVVVLPFVLYAAVRLRLLHVCLVVVAVSLTIVGLTVAGRSPYGTLEPQAAAIASQEFVLVTSVLSLGLSALLTSVRLGEARTRQANLALQRQAGVLEQSNAELRRIAFVAAHDLQTPLRSISRFSQLIADQCRGAMGPAVDDWVRRVTDNAARLDALLRDLGTLAEIDGSTSPHVPVAMDDVLDEVLWDLRGTIGEAGAVVRREPLPTVRGERDQLRRLVKELLTNAIKFRGADPPEIHVSARAEPAEWVFAVRDNGVGIAAVDQPPIFELFYRPESAKALPGTGFGLAMCARVVHRHDGRIWLESEPGKGSAFYFSLPRKARTEGE